MSKSAFTKKILLLEGIGFGLVISLLWVNELLDPAARVTSGSPHAAELA